MTANMVVISIQKKEGIDMDKAKLQVTLDIDTKKSLAKYAIDKERTMSDVVEDAIKNFLTERSNSKGLIKDA